MPDLRVFLSCVSVEFSIYRDPLRRYLARPNVTLDIQEDFISTGTETLDKLDLYIRQCDAVIHLVGNMTGAMAQANSVAVIRDLYPDLPNRFPALKPFLEENGPSMSYTQWEAWLALFHRKRLFIAQPTKAAPRDRTYCLDRTQRLAQQEHLNRLKSVERYPEIRFANADALAAKLLGSTLQDIFAKDEGQGHRSILLRRTKNGMPGNQEEIYSDRLPTVAGKFFGRKAELKLLDDALADNGMRIIQFVAAGGTGKTKLLKYWLDKSKDRIHSLIAWSFFSQGASEDKQISATPFFNYAFEALKSDKTSFTTEEEKGEHLAQLLRQHRCLLVLDGLEPVQYPGKGMRGALKDRAVRQLLKSLAGHNNGLCIITTRIAVYDLSNCAAVTTHDLHNLAPKDGLRLLQSLKVEGSETELMKAAKEYGCHALALHLLGNAVATYFDGDINKRDTLDELIDDYDDMGRHAFKVMQAYSQWLEGTPELKLLQLLGLFDHPVETEVLQVLWQTQIPELTDSIPEKAWKVAIRDLRDRHQLLSVHEGRPDLLDCHPLIREYFGKQLHHRQPQGWRQAHEILLEYYKVLSDKKIPGTLEEMHPLFRAVAHGCAAGLHQQALDEIYWPRINRGKDNLYAHKFGSIGDIHTVTSYFFDTPWIKPSEQLDKQSQVKVLDWAGFHLRTQGRLVEAEKSTKLALKMSVQEKYWTEATKASINLTQLYITTGNLKAAIEYAETGEEEYANQCEEKKWLMFLIVLRADALHQMGRLDEAKILLIKAEQIQKQLMTERPRLYSMSGFIYCDLLLAQRKIEEALNRTEYSIAVDEKEGLLGGIAFDNIIFAYIEQLKCDFQSSANHLELAIRKLQQSERWDFLPRAFLAKAAVYMDPRNPYQDFTCVRKSLREAYEIAKPSEQKNNDEFCGMRLYLADYHLGMARLLLAEAGISTESNSHPNPVQKSDEIKQAHFHVKQAAQLIADTGYHRRDAELNHLEMTLIGCLCH